VNEIGVINELKPGTVLVTVTDAGLFDVMVVDDSYIGCFDYHGLEDVRELLTKKMGVTELWVDHGKTVEQYTDYDKFLKRVAPVNLEQGLINII